MVPEHNFFQVAGVDGCKAGWFVAIISATLSGRPRAPCVYRLKDVSIASTFAVVLSKTKGCKLVCIDIPIGLSDGDRSRQCDIAARRLLGGRRASSVFPTPIRPCLSTEDYERASRISFEHSGKKLTRQSFALLKKIRQVDDLMTPELQERVREIHPEVSFWVLNSKRPIQHNKKAAPGQDERHRLLQEIVVDMDGILARAPAHGYGKDDALDALAAAWTAGRTVIGKAGTLPEKPEIDSKGLRMEILCPIK